MNPKDAIGLTKSPLRLVPPALVIETAVAMANGAEKYGPYNWRETGVNLSVYLEALLRHVYAYMDGEESAEDSGVKHLAHAAACLAIIFDAESVGKLIDDRPTPGQAARLMAEQTQQAPTVLNPWGGGDWFVCDTDPRPYLDGSLPHGRDSSGQCPRCGAPEGVIHDLD